MSNSGFIFNDRDIEIVHYVHQLRVATIDHLAVLTDRSHKTLERRLPKLREGRYLTRLRPRPHQGLYVLGPEGVKALIEEGYAPDDFGKKRHRESEWKDLYIPHALLVASIHVSLLTLTRQGAMTILDWQHDQSSLWDSVETAADGKLPIQPDAYFTIGTIGSSLRERFHFFLEADVGTMSHTRIAKKIKAYAAYHQQQRHVARFGIPYFHVAVITQTKTRADNLLSELHPPMSIAQRRAYHFLSLDELSLDALLGHAKPSAALLTS